MKKSSRSVLNYANIWLFALIADVALLALAVVIATTDLGGNFEQQVIYLVIGFAVVGLIYNLIFSSSLTKHNEFLARYAQLLFPLVGVGLIAFFGGGTGSSWYLAFLFMLIICAILGYQALYIDLFMVSAFLLLDIFFNIFVSSNGQFEFRTFPITIGALLCAWLVAYSTEQFKRATGKVAQIDTQLNSAQLSERIMLTAMADPVIGIDGQKNIVLMNPAAQNLSGWDSSEAIGIKYNQVFKLRDKNGNPIDDTNDPFNIALEHSDIAKTDELYLLRSKDNQKISLSISIAPTRNFQGRVTGAIAVIRDISQQQAVNRDKSEFVSTASHEMRTPVAAIEGFLSMAMNPKIATIDSRAEGYLQKAHEASIHLGKLFADLLSVTKIEDKDFKTTRKVFNISDVVLKTAAQMEPMATAKNIKLTTHIGGSKIHDRKIVAPAYMVLADPERIAEVITNLIDNAIKYTPKGGVDVEILSSGDHVMINVEDSGVGISSQEQKHIFEKFYRVNNSFTREQAGTGLGLFISRNIVELYGGKISVESEPGRGSTFSIRLPLTKNVAN